MKISLHQRHRVAHALAIASVSAASLGSAYPQTNLNPTKLAPVVVTATRFSSLLDESINDVRTIDRSTLEKWSASDLKDFLVREAGFNMTSNGGAGQTSNMFLRGLDTRHTILLIDGVRYGSVSNGAPDWRQIPIDLIEKIEVVRGPASSLYGSEAAAGVVQIFTRRSTQNQQPFQPFASIGYGSDDRQKYNLGAQGGDGQWEYFVALDGDKQKGFSATNSKNTYGYNPDSDPYRSYSLQSRLAYRFNDDYQVELSTLRSRGVNYFDDGIPEAFNDIGNDVYTAKLTGDITPIWRAELSAVKSANLLSTEASFGKSKFDSYQKQIILQNQVTTDFGKIMLGGDAMVQDLDSTTAFQKTQRKINALFAGWQHKIGVHRWQANVRNDDNSQFGNAKTYSLGYGLRLAEQWQARLSYGTFFSAPSFARLYYPGYANPDLQPEKGNTVETGIDWLGDNSSVKLTYYETRINNYFTMDENWISQNGGRAKVSGVELGYDWQKDNWRIKAGGQYMDARDKTTNNLLPWRAPVQFYSGVEYDNGTFSTGANARYVGKRYNDTTNTLKLGDYALVDTFVRYPFAKEWVAQLQIDNLFDKTYETVYGYNQPGLQTLVTVVWKGW